MQNVRHETTMSVMPHPEHSQLDGLIRILAYAPIQCYNPVNANCSTDCASRVREKAFSRRVEELALPRGATQSDAITLPCSSAGRASSQGGQP